MCATAVAMEVRIVAFIDVEAGRALIVERAACFPVPAFALQRGAAADQLTDAGPVLDLGYQRIAVPGHARAQPFRRDKRHQRPPRIVQVTFRGGMAIMIMLGVPAGTPKPQCNGIYILADRAIWC